MRPLHAMEIIQIDITNACINRCSNCTRLIGHHRKPFFMDFDTFRRAVDSLAEFSGIVGMIGGEPLLHPDFARMATYLAENRPDKDKRGLWSTIPEGNSHGALIKDVFGKLFLNDHAVTTIMHQPILVAAEEVIPDEDEMWRLIDACWVQNYWSASITPKGAYFCEVAAAFDMLFDGPGGWDIEPGWWKREPAEFEEQKQRWCRHCGCAVPLNRRPSVDSRDDVSPGNLERLHSISSPGLALGRAVLYQGGFANDWHPGYNWYMSEVEEEVEYRGRIAARLNQAQDTPPAASQHSQTQE